MANPSLRATGFQGSSFTTTSLTVTPSATILEGDVILLYLRISNAASPTITPPAGFTLVTSLINNNGSNSYLYEKTGTVSEPANYVISFPSDWKVSVLLAAYMDASSVDTASIQHENDGSDLTFPNITVGIPGTIALLGNVADSTETFTPASGFTERLETVSDTQAGTINDKTPSGVGSAGGPFSVTRSIGTTKSKVCCTVQIAAPQTAPPTWDAPDEGSSQRRELELLLDWTFNDPNAVDAQSAYTLKRVVDAVSTTYWNGSGWQASEDSSTKIVSTSTQHTLTKNWAIPEDVQHVYSVKTWDDSDNESAFSDPGLTVYPASIASSSRGLAFPKPWKRQEDILATLKANNDYLLAFQNNYVPTYGDANQDLTLRAGLRTSNSSLMRDIFPPVIGSYSVGNGTNFFQDLGATNVYRTNELALSSRHAKVYEKRHKLPNAVEFISSIPVETYAYKDKKRMGDAKTRIGLTAEDVADAVWKNGETLEDSSLVIQGKDENGESTLYLNESQLIPVLWQAVQELAAEVFKLKETKTNPGDSS